MSKLSNATRLACTAAILGMFAIPHAAIAQGKGNGADKGKHNEGQRAARVDPAPKAGDADRGRGEDNTARVRSDAGTVSRALKPVKVKRVPRGLAGKPVTTSRAVFVTRNVLTSKGYQVVQVVPSGTAQVIYYRRGNRGNGRGLGPVEKIVVIPNGQTVQFRSVPQSLLATILSQLGM